MAIVKKMAKTLYEQGKEKAYSLFDSSMINSIKIGINENICTKKVNR